ncbi:hypothetical protein M422DRAFT_248023 [Sphaerobolus stellatus SS14]|nr:hypothetical protein M422DRAFT_248023 [Sphaerobolus stellatus SS14]
MADELDKLTGDDILSASMEMTDEITHYVPRSYHPVPIGDILIREFLQKRRRSYVAIFGFASVERHTSNSSKTEISDVEAPSLLQKLSNAPSYYRRHDGTEIETRSQSRDRNYGDPSPREQEERR